MADIDDGAETPARVRRRVLGPAVGGSIVGIFVILLIGALHYAQHFVVPIVLAVLLALTFSPTVAALARRGIPAVLSAFLIVVALAVGTVAMSMILSGPIADMVAEAPTVAQKLRGRFEFISQPLAQLSRASREIEAVADGAAGGSTPQKVVVAGPGLISWVAGGLANIGTTLAVTLALAPFLLASRDSFCLRLVRIAPRFSGRKRSLQMLGDIENESSRYLLTVSVINCGLGTLVGTTMALLGMPNPWLWGLGAALLNFIPYAGPFLGILLTAVVALITFDSVGAALVPPLAYLVLQVVEGTLVTPVALGRRLEINVVAILIMLTLTTWMWGAIGAVIGVPLLVIIKVFCDRLPSLAPFAVFLSSGTSVSNGASGTAAGALPGNPQPETAGDRSSPAAAVQPALRPAQSMARQPARS
jgi:predicted PurR-regulated permease PerM